MIDERFSAESFASLGLGTEAARDRADLLAEEIQKEMYRVIEPHLSRIIEDLNAMGHTLKPEYPHIPGDFSYRDDWKDEGGYHCKLLVAFDTIVTTGYGHLITVDEALASAASNADP